MNLKAMSLSAGIALCCVSYGAAEESKDEQRVEQTRLKDEFKVDDARIQGLRDQKMGYGEISIALALAEKMPGGITDANVQAIMAQREGPPKMGWGQIAKKQGTTLGALKGRVKDAEAIAAKREKQDRKDAKGEKADKPGRADKAQRPEHHEAHARSEKVDRPSHAKR